MSNWEAMRNIGPSYAMHALTGELRAIRREVESIEVLGEDQP